MSFCSKTPKFKVLKFSKLGFSALWKAITSHVNLWLRWGLKQSYSFHWKFFNDMWHATYTHVFQGNFWFLMVGSQIDNLIFSPSFGHKLCFKYSNESCNLILNIYIWRTFQWYKFFFNLMNFNPWNTFLKIREFVESLIPKVGTHLDVWVYSFTLSYTLENVKCDSQVSFSVRTFASPCFGRKSKFKVMTIKNIEVY
jgi:hypothetical protein